LIFHEVFDVKQFHVILRHLLQAVSYVIRVRRAGCSSKLHGRLHTGWRKNRSCRGQPIATGNCFSVSCSHA